MAQHVHQLGERGAAHDRIVHQHDALALEHAAHRVVLHLHAEVSNRLCGLDEGPTHVVVADQGVIDELIVENAGLANPPVEGPDFYQFFTLTNPGQLDDQIHPNDTGYESMSDEWCNTLNGQTLGGNTISCTP